MVLSSICLKNVRKHENIKITFADKLNYLVGGNGQGKTTILESIYYLCTTKSCSSNSDIETVMFGKNSFEISGEFMQLTTDSAKVIYSALDNRKNYLLNNKQVPMSAAIIGNFPFVLLTPADHSITQGCPADRRKFVNSVISQSSKTYLEILIEYNKILRHRSALLTRIRENGDNNNKSELNAWTQKLIQNGTEIIKHRINFSNGFNKYVAESYKKIMGLSEIPEISYSYFEGYSGDDIEDKFKLMLEERKYDEIKRAANIVGPHRDEFIYTLDGKNLRTFGSQGQHKTFQITLRFAEFFYLKDLTGKTPIFLLDDVFGELDAKRAGKISNYLGQIGQAFITLTDFGNFSFLRKGKEDKVIKLENGNVAYA
jgi:DNA replication and repair protein RecF